jgi:hypothetical protein
MAQPQLTINEVLPGIHHWTAFHAEEGTRERVSSYYVEAAGALIDPMVPEEEGLAWFERFDPAPQQVILTNHHHWRDSDRFVEAFDTLVRCSHRAREVLAEHRREAQPFNDADEVAPGVTAIEIGKLEPDETALHIAVDDGAIAFGDAVMRPMGGPLGFPPASRLGRHPDRVHEGLREAFRGILLREFDALLFAHGEPLANGGKAALRRFTEKPVGKPDYGDTL